MDSFRQWLDVAIGKLSILASVLFAVSMSVELRVFELLVWEYFVSIVSGIVYSVYSDMGPKIQFGDNRVSMTIDLPLGLPRHY